MENVDNQDVKTKKQTFYDKYKEKRPDIDFEDEESVFGAIDSDFDDKDSRLQRYDEESQKLIDLMSGDPRSGEIFNSWAKGGDPISSIIELYGDDFLDAMKSPEGREKYGRARDKYLERVAKSKEMDAKADENWIATLDVLEKYKKENGLSDEQISAVYEKANEIFQDGVLNIIKPETADMIAKALDFDTAVADARREGELQGRNARIKEKLKKQDTPTDIPPTLGGGNDGGVNTGQKPKVRRRYAFGPDGYAED